VDARIELMRCLGDAFDLSAVGSHPALRDKFMSEGFDYHVYHLNRQLNPLSDLLSVCQLMLLFWRLKPHVVHTFDTKPGVWGCLVARLAGVPVVISTFTGLGSLYGNDTWPVRFIRMIYQALRTITCHLSDLTIFQNHDDARQLVAAGIVPERKARVILGSGIYTSEFAPVCVPDLKKAQLRDELGLRSDEIIVTMISRVIRSKGVLDFVAAAQTVGKRYPNVRFLLVGPSDEESLDRLTAVELTQLKQAVIWPGLRRDIPTVLGISDIFVLPSAYREGIPRVLLEAASMGLPIVTTDSPGCREVVEEGVNGCLVPVCDAAVLGQVILRLIEQPELRQRFGLASRQRAVEQFDLRVIADQTRLVYQELLAQSTLLPETLPEN
jgi:glycosyltransferase involved in cell wall biosynthesis